MTSFICRFLTISFAFSSFIFGQMALAATHDVGKFPDREYFGDFDGDGNLDRVTATPHGDLSGGRVNIWFGVEKVDFSDLWWKGEASDAWPHEPIVLDEFEPIFAGQGHSGNYFGAGLVVGDFDQDKKIDIAFSAPGATVEGHFAAGRVYILYGRDIVKNNGVRSYSQSSTFVQGRNGVLGYLESYDYFGEFLGVGDLNCDGVDDLAVGVPREDLILNGSLIRDGGAVHVLYGIKYQGLGVDDDQFFGQEQLSGVSRPYDYFGAALSVGHYKSGTRCNHLAVGTPGKDINGTVNAGAVYTAAVSLYGQIFNGQFWHQDVSGIDGTPNAYEYFGSHVGNVDSSLGGGLWVEIPGELCSDSDERRFQTIRAGSFGLTTSGDKRFCSRHDPGMRMSEAGILIEKSDRYGNYMQYLPSGVNQNSRVLLVIHGTPLALEDYQDPNWHGGAAARFYVQQQALIDVAERENLILIAPGFSVPAFTSAGLAGGHPAGDLWKQVVSYGGYRMLYGRDIQADAWVNKIVDSYQSVGLLPTGKLYIYGHSAGAQMTSRYIARNANRILGAAMTSPNTVALPDTNLAWPNGLGYGYASFKWLNDDLNTFIENSYGYQPNEDYWAQALTRPIFIGVGEYERPPWNPGDTHVETADAYRDSALTFLYQYNQDNNTNLSSGVEFCMVPGIGHNYPVIHPWAIDFLFPDPNAPLKVCKYYN